VLGLIHLDVCGPMLVDYMIGVYYGMTSLIRKFGRIHCLVDDNESSQISLSGVRRKWSTFVTSVIE